uniref:Rab3 GTPase-activating protein catalytic subunit n=1 Tax=Panagrolaimus superbus TaxID=310955 RepID=A0A914Y5P6_9BILA
MDSIDETRPLIVSGGEDIFEITDFTVISDFEQFIVTLENAIHEWNLGTSDAKGVKRKTSKRFSTDFFQSCNWKNESKFITYPPHSELLLTHVWPEDCSATSTTESTETASEERFPVATNDLLLTESNFYPWSIITQQYGVFEYLLLSPAKDDSNNITSENESQMILSAIDIATVNSECTLPIFLQFGAPDRIFFIGSVQNGNIRTTFQTVHTHHAFSKHKCLSGLVDIFKERLNDSTIPALDITVAIELEYILRNDFDYDNDLHIDDEYIKNLDICTLPFGTRRDVVKEFRLLTGWPALKQEAITDTINYSDLDPYAAPRWRASVTFHKGVQGLLHSSLSKAKEYLKSTDEATVTEKLGPKPSESKSAADIFRPVVDGGGSGMNINIGAVQLPISDIKLKEIINSVFNVVYDNTPSNDHSNEIHKECENTLKSAKAALSGSIVDNLTKTILLALVQSESSKNRILTVCQIWEAFTEKVRSYWETNKDIPGLEDTNIPDLSKCLLHQKLQMIQCCIDSRRKRHELFDQTKNFSTHEDEFFDAPDEFSVNEETPLTLTDTVNFEPEGRLQKSETLKLLNRPEQPLYVPITQDRSPMTEDMLEEHAEYLASMPGDDRVKAQLDTLLSDMQAFKAANPGCCIEDFVRWHSPRDYVEEEDGTGHLSERMDMEDN